MFRTIAACLIAWLIALTITAATTEEPDFTDSGVESCECVHFLHICAEETKRRGWETVLAVLFFRHAGHRC